MRLRPARAAASKLRHQANRGKGGLRAALFLCRRASKAVIDRQPEAVTRNGRYGDPGLCGGVGQMEQVEQPGGGFDEVARTAQVGLAADRAEPDQKFVGFTLLRIQPQWLGRRIMGRQLARRLDPLAGSHLCAYVDRTWPQ